MLQSRKITSSKPTFQQRKRADNGSKATTNDAPNTTTASNTTTTNAAPTTTTVVAATTTVVAATAAGAAVTTPNAAGATTAAEATNTVVATAATDAADNTTTAADNSKVMPAEQTTDATNTKTRKDHSRKEGDVLKDRLKRVGITISPNLIHPEDIIKFLTEEINTMLDPLKQQLQTRRLICILVDFLAPTSAHKLLVKFLKKLGVELKIVGTETFKQLGCECGHISAQVIQLLANHGADWWSIPKEKFAECASDKSIAEVNEFLEKQTKDRNFTGSSEVIQFAKSRIESHIDIKANGYLGWNEDMDKPLTQALITILEDLHEYLNNNNRPFDRTMLINTDWLFLDKGSHWMTLKLASQSSKSTDIAESLVHDELCVDYNSDDDDDDDDDVNHNTQEAAITNSPTQNQTPPLGMDNTNEKEEGNTTDTMEVTDGHIAQKRTNKRPKPLACLNQVKRSAKSNKRPGN